MYNDREELERRVIEKYGDGEDYYPEHTRFDEIGIGFLEDIHGMDLATAQEIENAVKEICRKHGYRDH